VNPYPISVFLEELANGLNVRVKVYQNFVNSKVPTGLEPDLQHWNAADRQ
jgi:hypothetical protein